jgi:hypothetical protein
VLGVNVFGDGLRDALDWRAGGGGGGRASGRPLPGAALEEI